MGRSGVMNLGAFLDQLGGRMDEWRAALVDQAFDRIDAGGDGHLALDKVRQSKPPSLLARLYPLLSAPYPADFRADCQYLARHPRESKRRRLRNLQAKVPRESVARRHHLFYVTDIKAYQALHPASDSPFDLRRDLPPPDGRTWILCARSS